MTVTSRSTSIFVERSASEYRASLDELFGMVDSLREWLSALLWLSSSRFIARLEREAVGRDGELYEWTRLIVGEGRDGRFASVCDFDVDDEVAAFAYAEERARATSSRLAVSNRASLAADCIVTAMRTRDIEIASAAYADEFTYDDHRRFGGEPIADGVALRAGMERIGRQYSVLEVHTLAVRGDRLELAVCRWSDDAGNRAEQLRVIEIDLDGRIIYQGVFDEDDFEGAHGELDHRYYTGEGAAFADSGAVLTAVVVAMNRGEFGHMFTELVGSDFRLVNRSRSAFPDRSAAELRAALEELSAMVASVRAWTSAVCWLSSSTVVMRMEREATGFDGERYEWTRVLVAECRGGRLISLCDFDADAEREAFAFADAEVRVHATSSSLSVTNRASEVAADLTAAMQTFDAVASVAMFSTRYGYDDRRRLSGAQLEDLAEMRTAFEEVFEQFTRFEARTMAVRGSQSALVWSRWSDDAGNETIHLNVVDIGTDRLIGYLGRFDEGDFEGAYRELDRRYYAGEGAAIADSGSRMTEWLTALNRNDFDRVFGDLSSPELRFENRSRSAFPDRSATEVRAGLEELNAMVGSVRAWVSCVCWLSPTWAVNLFEREAIGKDGERYGWTRVFVTEYRHGLVALLCEFNVEDEAAAFAYAEERSLAAYSRLPLTNRASEVTVVVRQTMQRRDADASSAIFADRFTYDDRRRLSGEPIASRAAMRTALARVFTQFTHFEVQTLAVRGELLALVRNRWSDDAGNETTSLYVFELGADALVGYMGRFDDDDFEAAYRELDRRYYAGEAAAVSSAGAVLTDVMIAMNRGDFEYMFAELVGPHFRLVNRSRSAFPDRSAAELRAALEDLNAMVASVRAWNSAVCWLSSTTVVMRMEREATGPDGERYEWTRLLVAECRDGRLVSLCDFDADAEREAFAFGG